MKKILVTGATGLVGNNVVRLLLERGDAVRVLARDASAARPLEGLDLEIVRGDVRDAASVQRAVAGVDGVVHAAALVHIGWRRLGEMTAINVDGTRHAARAARAAGVPLVHVSTVDACGIGDADQPVDEETTCVGDVLTSYVVTKRAAEQVIQEEVAAGLHASIVNPAFMLGPWDWRPSSGRMLLEVASGRARFAPAGTMSLCDVRDVAAGTLAALERGAAGRRYILAGEFITYFEAWRRFAAATEAKPPIMAVGPVIGNVAGWAGDLWGRLSGNEPVVNSGAIRMARLPNNFSSRRAEEELGYQRRPSAETIADAWRWFREYGYA